MMLAATKKPQTITVDDVPEAVRRALKTATREELAGAIYDITGYYPRGGAKMRVRCGGGFRVVRRAAKYDD